MEQNFSLCGLIGGIVAGGIELLARYLMGRHDTVAGASGIVYASLGVLFASSLYVSVSHIFDGSIKQILRNMRRLLDFALNATIFIFLVSILTSNPSDFLSVGPKAGVFSHGYGFLLGLISIALFYNFTRKQRGKISA